MVETSTSRREASAAVGVRTSLATAAAMVERPVPNHPRRSHPRRSHPRASLPRAFSLVELIVVIAIIGVLFSLLLPAVQAARESARRTLCGANLTQLIMAVHQYEAAQRVLPPGTVNPRGPILNQLTGYHHGWIEQVTPYLEQAVIFYHVDRDVSVYHPNNAAVRQLNLRDLQCPSSRRRGRGYSNYAGVHHDVESAIDRDQNGVFFLNSAVTLDDVSDGIGNTIFLSEKLHEVFDLGWLSGTRAILRNTGDEMNVARTEIRKIQRWAYGDGPPGLSTTANQSQVSGSTPRTAADFVGGFASEHANGVNCSFGDGSVRFVTTSIEQSIYRQLGNRRDGQICELDF